MSDLLKALSDWADAPEPRPEIDALRIAVAQADAGAEYSPT